jgi:hypothetical protein
MSEANQSQPGAYELYSPLPAGKWTRLLLLEPGAIGDPIDCSLHAAKFDTQGEILRPNTEIHL